MQCLKKNRHHDVSRLHLDISGRRGLIRNAPVDFITVYEIKALAPDPAKEVSIGEACAALINGNFLRSKRMGMERAMKDFSSLLSRAYDEIFDSEGEYQGSLQDIHLSGNNILVIDYIYLDPEYRGMRLGQALMAEILKDFSDIADLIVLQPGPLSPAGFKNSGKTIPVLNSNQKNAVREKLYRYWQYLGFRPIFEGSKFLFFSTHERIINPVEFIQG